MQKLVAIMMSKLFVLTGLPVGMVLLGVVFGLAQPAQTAGVWTKPQQLSAEPGTTPFILADSGGGVHVFWGSVGQGDQVGAIFYERLAEDGWSETVDILASPSGNSAINPSAVIDSAGYIHLIWVSQSLYYSRAHISQALNPRGWSVPYKMTNYAIDNGVIQLGSDSSLNVLFGSRGTNPAVYLLKSLDSGDFWRIAVQVSAPQRGAYSLTCSLVIDAQGILHAAWGEAVQAMGQEGWVVRGNPIGVYYAHSNDGGEKWTYPRAMAHGEYSEPVLGIDGQNNIHLLLSGLGGEEGKYHTWLDHNSGEWSDLERVFAGSELSLGAPALAVDSAGHLHAAFPLVNPSSLMPSSRGEIVSARWEDERWKESYPVTEGLMGEDIGNRQPSLTISTGNMLHLVWVAENQAVDNTGGGGFLWYASREVDAPHLEITLVPGLLQAQQTATPKPLAQTPEVMPTPWKVIDDISLLKYQSWHKNLPVLVGSIISCIFLFLVLRFLWEHRGG